MLCYACVKTLDVSCIIEIQLSKTDPVLCYACVKTFLSYSTGPVCFAQPSHHMLVRKKESELTLDFRTTSVLSALKFPNFAPSSKGSRPLAAECPTMTSLPAFLHQCGSHHRPSVSSSTHIGILLSAMMSSHCDSVSSGIFMFSA